MIVRSGIILAGGKSQRMGQKVEKGLLEFHGKPLIGWMLDILEPVVDEIIISVSKGKSSEYIEQIGNYKDMKMVEDIYHGIGPIGGLLSSFSEASGEYIAVAPCDSPFIVPELYPLLFELAQDHDGAVPKLGGYFEPLHAVYKQRTSFDAFTKTLEACKFKPIDAYEYLDLCLAVEDNIIPIDAELRSFININTQLDLNDNLQMKPI
jgi:molybdopterin-guanine dinucleotide biosynthesis protein A